jgi:hypothetical protein
MPGGKHVVSGDFKGQIFTWSFEDAKRMGSFKELRSEVIEIVPKTDSAFVAMDRTGIAKGSLTSLRGNVRPFTRPLIGATALSQNGSRIAFHLGNSVKVAAVSRQKIEGDVGYKGAAKSMQFTTNQRYLLLQQSEEVSLWDWRNEEKIRRFRLPGKFKAGPFSLSPNDQFVAITLGAEANQIGVFELLTEK